MLPGGADPDVSCGPDCALHDHVPLMKLHGNVTGLRDVHARPTPAAPPPARRGDPTHVWVQTTDGRVPGFLVEWARRDGTMCGRCYYPRRGHPGSSDWVIEQDWVPASRLERA